MGVFLADPQKLVITVNGRNLSAIDVYGFISAESAFGDLHFSTIERANEKSHKLML